MFDATTFSKMTRCTMMLSIMTLIIMMIGVIILGILALSIIIKIQAGAECCVVMLSIVIPRIFMLVIIMQSMGSIAILSAVMQYRNTERYHANCHFTECRHAKYC
jgi:hypothetical protein